MADEQQKGGATKPSTAPQTDAVNESQNETAQSIETNVQAGTQSGLESSLSLDGEPVEVRVVADETNGGGVDKTADAELKRSAEALSAAQEELNSLKDAQLRLQAEMENLRRRAQREAETARKFALERFVSELLPVVDSLELGIDAARSEEASVEKLREGKELTLKALLQTLNRFEVAQIDPRGEPFDPERHQAISVQESNEQPPNSVLSVMQKGYLLNDRLVRPALVVVAKAATSDPSAAAE